MGTDLIFFLKIQTIIPSSQKISNTFDIWADFRMHVVVIFIMHLLAMWHKFLFDVSEQHESVVVCDSKSF